MLGYHPPSEQAPPLPGPGIPVGGDPPGPAGGTHPAGTQSCVGAFNVLIARCMQDVANEFRYIYECLFLRNHVQSNN